MSKEPPSSHHQSSRRLKPYQCLHTPALALRVVATGSAVTAEDEDVPPGRNADNRWNHTVPEPIQSSEVSSRVLLIKNFSSETTESQVREGLFGAFEVIDFLRLTDQTNDTICEQAYILMATRHDAVRAQEIIDGQEFMGRIVGVNIVRHGQFSEVTDCGFLTTLDKYLSDGTPIPIEVYTPHHVIDIWLGTLPSHPSEHTPLSVRPVHGPAVYHDWLDWYEDRGRHFLLELDKYEQQHRTIGLKYHALPYELRHAPAHRDGAAINPTVVDRLSNIYETNQPTHQQRFYGRWLRVRGAVESAVDDIRRMDGSMQTPLLRDTHRRVATGLGSVLGDLRHIGELLESLEQLVETISRRRIHQRSGDPMESLRSKHSSGGSCFRRWVWTFAEVQSLRGVHLPSHVENVAQRLMEEGVEMGRYWRSSVP
ncbi:hypothetical protein K505DRAFT_336889 [Melanomma pulvis-pyrius CBS 109.77]|uniref:RRM domain-containing protein n=1 Tax=Melanomma pulvis-pyrius CBS 109.77 TaxID=1314802 RepID=A0A6A6XDY5_9PLEO|nr:hypothetical protein K505DRAFT_336889 [Melanomma pulvis-pyrius CBS 109.77]